MRPLTLKTKLFLQVGGTLTLLAVLGDALLLNHVEGVLRQAAFRRYAETAAILADSIGEELQLGNWALANLTVAERWRQDPNVLYVTLTDEEGITQVALDPREIGKKAEEDDALSAGVPILEINAPLPLHAMQAATLKLRASERAYDISMPLKWSGKPGGIFRLGLSRAAVDGELVSARWLLLAIDALLLLTMIFVMTRVARAVSSPLTDLASELERQCATGIDSNAVSGLKMLRLEKIPEGTKEVALLKESFLHLRDGLIHSLSRIADLSHAEVENKRLAAIAQTTQMLAHDVRKPFSMMRLCMQRLGGVTSLSEIQSTLQRTGTQIDTALQQVNGMLVDIMEVGTNVAPHLEAVDLEGLARQAVGNVMVLSGRTDVQVATTFGHQGMVLADPNKLRRVLSNLIENAVHATPLGGATWLRTSERAGWLECRVGNSGSYVPPAKRQCIFDAYYTERKRGGTGLGLAIAKKIVLAHGGSIWCESDEKEGTEFVFTLRLAGGEEATQPRRIRPKTAGEKRAIRVETL